MTEVLVTQADITLAERIISNVRGYGITINPEHSAARSIAEYRLAAEQSRASTPAVDREAIARIIDPAAWETYDYWAGRLRGDGHWPSDPDQVEAIRSSYERRMPVVVAESLAKAAAILALHPPAIEAENARLRAENAKFRELLAPFGAVADEYDRWQRKGSTTTEPQVRFGYGRCQFGLPEFRAIRATLSTEQVSQP